MKIAHLADIQIRNFSRHDEYRESFRNLYESLRLNKPDRIVIVGDIAHTKTQISPEFVDICSDLFTNLAEIAPLDLTLGNHDGNLKNPSRMDAISPIVKSLANPRISLYKNSGVYSADASFNYIVFSCFGSEGDWVPYERLSESEKSKVNIALFHGTVDGTVLNNGFILTSPYKLDMFQGYDYVMLGDIHQTLILDQDSRVAYPGSYPQQSYAEATARGYFLWDIESKDKHSLKFIELPNVCPFYNLGLTSHMVQGGVKVPDYPFQERARIRVQSDFQLTPTQEAEVREELQKKWAPVEIKFVDIINISSQEVKKDLRVKLENLRNASVQEELIRDFFKNTPPPEEDMRRVFEINRQLNAHVVKEEETLRNVRYKFLTSEFSNLFSFGENNSLDYKQLTGICGVFGRNGVGKSSLVVDVPLYVMFNKISKEGAIKNSTYVNEHSQSGTGKVCLEFDNIVYEIERTTELYLSGKRSGKEVEKGQTDVSFRSSANDLTGQERADTDKEIRKIFGTAEDFMLTAIAPQFELINFIKNRGTDRKKIIGRYFDLDFMEEKHYLANEELKELKKRLKLYEIDHDSEISKVEDDITKLSARAEELERLVRELSEKKEKLLTEEIKTQHEKKEAANKSQAEVIRSRLKKEGVEKDIASRKKMLADLEKSTCIKNPDCCLREQQSKLTATIKGFQDRLMVCVAEYERLKQQEAVHVVPHDDAEWRQQNSEISSQIGLFQSEFQRVSQNLGGSKIRLQQLLDSKKQYEAIKKEHDAYYYFTQAFGKDGIPYNIIAQNIHLINSEIKKLLAGAVNFDIVLEQEDSKEINVYFKHGRSKKRIIEICGGAEKTIAAIAIRAALLSVTTLPVSNIIVFDEIFDSLDAENLDAAVKILQNLKRLFEVVIVITHSDAVKDICDNVIFVERDSAGFSKIT
jgi:DNA repair exonuclease SbcCD ATPase subunit/DNA repair exonuclease SbcCD nuclease subunit